VKKVPPAPLRFLLAAAFLVLVAAAVRLVGLDMLWIGVAVLGACLLAGLVVRSRSSRRWEQGAEAEADPAPAPERRVEAAPEPEPEPAPKPEPAPEPERKPDPKPEPVLAAVPQLPREPDPQPEPDPQAEPVVVPLALRDRSPRSWNLWELESLAAAMNGDSRAEERALLLLHLREYADAAGNLPLEFDPLVRDVFGAGLAELVT